MTIEEAIKHGEEQLEIFGGEHKEFIRCALDALKRERKKGRWIRHESPNLGKCMKVLYECSVCNACLGCEYFLRRSFCPNCGAKMEGAEE